MTTTLAMVLLILSCAAVTWIPRVLPFAVVRNIQMPKIVYRWLAYIPVCILSALVIEGLFIEKESYVAINWMSLVAFVPTLAIALWTKSLAITVVAGVITMAILRYIL